MVKTANLATRLVRYLESGAGPVVLLLHAFPLNAEQWLPQVSKGVPGWKLIAPDLRGFGPVEPAGAVAGGASVERHAADVLDLMNHLEVRDAVVGGSSLGAEVGLAIARQAPSRVSALLLIGRRSIGFEGTQGGPDRLLAVLERDGPLGVAREIVATLLAETTRREQPDLVEAVRHLIEASSPEGLAAGIRAIQRPAATPVAETYCGALLPDAGPLANLEAPLVFNDALASFLREVARRVAPAAHAAAGAGG
jgi:pimeloyl-ACP methyl ester carboxylesterase